MIETGRATLYLTVTSGVISSYRSATHGKITNWPGSLSFPCIVRKGRHNIARVRYDANFAGPDGNRWHGVQYGDNTQIIHCKRLKG